MKTSERLRNLVPGGDDGWGLFYKARALVAAGEPVIELTIGEHDIRTHPRILAAMQTSAERGHTGYAAVPGVAALRDAVAARVQSRTGVATTRENVVITPGGQAALFAAHMAACDPGQTSLFIDPYYATYPGTLRGAGAVPRAIETRPEAGFQPTYEDLAPHAGGAASLLINTPNNPTGAVYSQDTLDGISRLCTDHDLWLVSDEVYDTQVWDGAHISPRALPDMAGRTLVVGSMSKSHAMTGSRVGWVIGPPDVVSDLINLATHTTYGVPGYIQDAALFALTEGEALEQEVSAPFARRREIVRRLLDGQNRIELLPPQGAMYVMLNVRETGLTGAAFAEALLDAERIAVMPGASFGKAARDHVRVAMTVEDARFEEAMTRLLAFAQTAGR